MNGLSALITAQEQSSGSPLGLLIILVPFGLLIWMMIVPQRKQRARHQQLMASLDVGEEVVTAGGIVGVITHIEDDLIHLEVDHDVVIRMAKSSISRSTAEPEGGSGSSGGLLGGLFGGGSKAAASSDDDAAVRTRTSPKGGGSATPSKRITPPKGADSGAKKK